MWLIDLPSLLTIVLTYLKRVVLGEFMDDLEIGKNIMEFFGID